MKITGIATVLCLCAAIAPLIVVRVDAQNQAPGSPASSPRLKQVGYMTIPGEF
jgi:hypothetical protein